MTLLYKPVDVHTFASTYEIAFTLWHESLKSIISFPS